VMRAPTRGLAKALRSIYWGGGGGPALPPARSVRPACGVYKTRQDKATRCAACVLSSERQCFLQDNLGGQCLCLSFLVLSVLLLWPFCGRNEIAHAGCVRGSDAPCWKTAVVLEGVMQVEEAIGNILAQPLALRPP
jgi:hypothetical protein